MLVIEIYLLEENHVLKILQIDLMRNMVEKVEIYTYKNTDVKKKNRFFIPEET